MPNVIYGGAWHQATSGNCPVESTRFSEKVESKHGKYVMKVDCPKNSSIQQFSVESQARAGGMTKKPIVIIIIIIIITRLYLI